MSVKAGIPTILACHAGIEVIGAAQLGQLVAQRVTNMDFPSVMSAVSPSLPTLPLTVPSAAYYTALSTGHIGGGGCILAGPSVAVHPLLPTSQIIACEKSRPKLCRVLTPARLGVSLQSS